MSESLTSQTILGYSTSPESTYGTYPVLASNFTPMVTRVRELPLPDSEKTDDRGVIGRGDAMYPQFQRSGFRVPTAFSLSDIAQVGALAPLLRRYTGKPGASPTTVEAGIAFLHKFYEINPTTEGLQLPSSSWIYSNNEYDHLLSGGCGSTLEFAQTGTADPTFTLAMICSGFSKRISAISGFGSLAVPGVDPYMYGPMSGAIYTDDSSATINLTTPTHKLRTLQFTANNNLITGDTRMGMPPVDATQPKIGWYRDFLHFGDRDISAVFTMGMDGDYSLMTAEQLNTNYTNFTWTMTGDFIPTTATSSQYYLKVIIPKFTLRAPTSGEDNVKKTKGFTIFPLINATHYGVYHLELQNGVSTTIA